MSEWLPTSLIYSLATIGLLASICCALYLLMHILVALTLLLKHRIEDLFDWCDVEKLVKREHAEGRLRYRSKGREE